MGNQHMLIDTWAAQETCFSPWSAPAPESLGESDALDDPFPMMQE